MRIALITDAWLPQTNGVVRTLIITVEKLSQAGHEVTFIARGAHLQQLERGEQNQHGNADLASEQGVEADEEAAHTAQCDGEQQPVWRQRVAAVTEIGAPAQQHGAQRAYP